MRKHDWSLCSLSEEDPASMLLVHGSNSVHTINDGPEVRSIFLVFQNPRAGNTILSPEYLTWVMLHELVHMEIQGHEDDFKALHAVLKRESVEFRPAEYGKSKSNFFRTNSKHYDTWGLTPPEIFADKMELARVVN